MSGFTPNDEQRQFLNHDSSQCGCLLAGPGTGKSATVVAYLQDLLTRERPPRIRLLTFTRAATAELAEKLAGHEAVGQVHRPGTIHSFAISVLLRNPGTGGFPEPLRIADRWEFRNLVLETLKQRTGLRVNELENLFREMAAGWESLKPHPEAHIPAAVRARFQGAWTEHRAIYGYTLLAELPYALRRALESHEDLAGLDYDLLVVDEYQDLNACDLDVLRRIAMRGCCIIAAGDDDQSIYSFRKADPAGIRQFATDYPGSKLYNLKTTMRCSRTICDWANFVIQGDPDRPVTRPVVVPHEQAPDGEVAFLTFPGAKTEARGVAELVRRLIEVEGIPPAEILVLVRSDYNRMFSQPIRTELESRGIKCTDPTLVDSVLADPTNRQLMSLMRLLVNQEDSLAWATLLRLRSGINTKTFLAYLYDHARSFNQTLARALLTLRGQDFPNAPGRTGKIASRLVDEVQLWLVDHSIGEAPADTRWGRWILKHSGATIAPKPTEELQTFFDGLDAVSEEGITLDRFLGQIEPLARDQAQTRSDGVRIMSMTASKGLTVRAAILCGLEDGIIPRPDEDQGEARRLLYVGMTRARQFLYCTWARQRKGPTARSGRKSLDKRLPTGFLERGSVRPQDGDQFIKQRWPASG